MFDQNITAANFHDIYQKECRMGRMSPASAGGGYADAVAAYQKARKDYTALRRKKRTERTEKDQKEADKLKKTIDNLKEKKALALDEAMRRLSAEANDRNFRFHTTYKDVGGKAGLMLDSEKMTLAEPFVMKLLQRNLTRTFKVKQANRHRIMNDVRRLLEHQHPYYLIRTDVSSFFESIPHNRLLERVTGSPLLSYRTKALVRQIVQMCKGDCGIPRGIGVSSPLSEIYMSTIDSAIRMRPEVVYYARYVDDIIILLANLPQGMELETYYDKTLVEPFKKKYGLDLKQNGSGKCYLANFSITDKPVNFSYLGYSISIWWEDKPKGNSKIYKMCMRMSKRKFDNMKRRIDNAFRHFALQSKSNIHEARLDLLDCLRYLTGNMHLTKAKAMAKTGLYYNNAQLNSFEDLVELTDYVHNHDLQPYDKLFADEDAKAAYIGKLRARLKKFDFVEAWKERRMFSFKTRRLNQITRWIDEDEKETKEDTPTL